LAVLIKGEPPEKAEFEGCLGVSFSVSLPTVSMSCITKECDYTRKRRSSAKRHQKWCSRGTKKRGGRLGDEVTSQTQAIQSIANNETKRARPGSLDRRIGGRGKIFAARVKKKVPSHIYPWLGAAS
jgi:hypothetical protein